MIGADILLKLAPFAIVGAAAVAAYQFAPLVGVNAQRHRLEDARDKAKVEATHWKEVSDAWEASFHKSEQLRGEENQAAVAAVDATAAACNTRVEATRKSAKAIKRIVDAPVKLDASNCPVRTVVGTDLLRDALQPH